MIITIIFAIIISKNTRGTGTGTITLERRTLSLMFQSAIRSEQKVHPLSKNKEFLRFNFVSGLKVYAKRTGLFMTSLGLKMCFNF